ncbi:MAG TPA: hypothetical protein VJX28_08290 [Chthoniobacterales bacterium]|nr:hypothetical protein [Chthoniobacterales bacterium]
MLSKLLPDGIENGFPLFGKPAQNKHGFGSNRVNDVANFFVVEEQVDELGDLDVVDGDNWLTQISDDQVLLLCTFVHLYTPYRHAIDGAPGEYRIAKIGPN